jgi:hypothetical protein
MKCAGRLGCSLLILVAAIISSHGVAVAADASTRAVPAQPAPAAQPAGWTVTVAAYAWTAGLDGTVRTLPPLPAVDVNLSIGDVLKNLDGAIMGVVEARNGSWLVMADLIYSSIAPSRNFAVAGVNGTVSLDNQAFIGLAAVGYRFWDDRRISVDGFVGARLWAMENVLSVAVPGVGSLSYGKSKSWVDGVVGVWTKVHLTDKLFASFMTSVGGLSADIEWDVYAGLNYAFADRWSAFAGYRWLHVDYQSGDFRYNATQHGPLFGVAFKL